MVEFNLFDIVEMKKPHPCKEKSKKFQVVRVGADIKIKCLSCGNVIMMEREKFESSMRKVISHSDVPIDIGK